MAKVLRSCKKAQSFGHYGVDTEHLLLGILREDESTAIRALALLGIDPQRVRTETEEQLGSPGTAVRGPMTLTPRGKRVIDLAYTEARHLKDNFIGTEHLLLGLIRTDGGVAGRVLAKLGVRVSDARNAVRQLQGKEPGDSAPNERKPGFFERLGFGRSKRD